MRPESRRHRGNELANVVARVHCGSAHRRELKLAEGGNVQRKVHTADGRVLAVEDRGDPAGRPVLVHHGSPSSRHSAFYGPYVRDAAERGLRLIGYDRPGYGE